MFNDSTFKAIKKLSVGSSDDRPLWQPSITTNAPDTLEGYQYVINQDMASIGSLAKSILFGDFSNYIIREVADWRLVRLVERYAELDQVAFVMFARYDGQVIDAGTNPIKYMKHMLLT
jgi:HK97 family phage major capsid protein